MILRGRSARNAQETVHGRADRLCAAAGGWRHGGGRDLPEAGRVGGDASHRWKKVYAGMGAARIRRLKLLEGEDGKLERLVAELSLDEEMLRGTPCEKSGEARPSPRGRAALRGRLRGLGPRRAGPGRAAIGRASHRYASRRDPQEPLRGRLKELAAARVRCGHRRLHVLAAARGLEGQPQAGPTVSTSRGGAVDPHPHALGDDGPAAPDRAGRRSRGRTTSGRWTSRPTGCSTSAPFRVLTVVDRCTREALSTASRTSFRA